MKRFLGKYSILILMFGACTYAILVKLSLIHTVDFETVFLGMSTLWVVEMFKVEHELGELRGKIRLL